MRRLPSVALGAAVMLASLLGGCTVHPNGEIEEREAASVAGRVYEGKPSTRPSLPAGATPEQLVEYALLNNAGLEQRYWAWRSAIEQIPQDGSQSTALNLAAGATINHGHTGWDATALTLANDPMTDIKWPGKLDAAARRALENARAAGHRFVQAKYEVRRHVLQAYYDYALDAELVRLEQSSQQLLQSIADTTAARNRVGSAGQQDLLKAKNEADLAGNDLATRQAMLVSRKAALRAVLGCPEEPDLSTAAPWKPGHPPLPDDATILARAAKANPELSALADEVAARQDGLALAKLQYVPEFNLSVSTDLAGAIQSILGQMTVPAFRYEAIEAAIRQAEADLNGARATRREAGNALTGQVVTALVTLRDADRQLNLLNTTVVPRAGQIVDLTRTAYVSGRSSLFDLLDSQRTLIGIERLVANLEATRGKTLAELEAITASTLTP